MTSVTNQSWPASWDQYKSYCKIKWEDGDEKVKRASLYYLVMAAHYEMSNDIYLPTE